MQINKILKSKLAMLLFLAIVVGAGFSVASEVSDRYQLETEISDLKQQVMSLEGRNSQLSDLIGYFESPEYREKEARSKLNLQLPGEHVVVIPPAEGRVESAVAEDVTEGPSNIVKWWDYFFGI